MSVSPNSLTERKFLEIIFLLVNKWSAKYCPTSFQMHTHDYWLQSLHNSTNFFLNWVAIYRLHLPTHLSALSVGSLEFVLEVDRYPKKAVIEPDFYDQHIGFLYVMFCSIFAMNNCLMYIATTVTNLLMQAGCNMNPVVLYADPTLIDGQLITSETLKVRDSITLNWHLHVSKIALQRDCKASLHIPKWYCKVYWI